MKTLNSTPSADTQAIISQRIEQSDALALQQAAQSQSRVKDVRGIQHEKLEELFTSSEDGPAEPNVEQQSALQEARKKVDAISNVREAQTADVADAKVMEQQDSTVGLQKDGSKEILLSDSILGATSLQSRPDLAKKVTKHELAHRMQEDGDASFSLPPTGNPALDENRNEIRRLVFRERDSMEAEGGVHAYTSRKYKEQYWNVAEAVKQELNKRGKNGDQLIHNAGKTMDGFRQMHRELVSAVISPMTKTPAVSWHRA